MLSLPALPSDEQLKSAVEQWIDALAAGDFETAFAMTAHDPYYQWSPALMQAVIAGYGHIDPHPDGTRYAVSDRLTASGGPPIREVDREFVPNGTIAHVRYDLPLNGEWSDVTATFSVVAHGGGTVLSLEEIHVF